LVEREELDRENTGVAHRPDLIGHDPLRLRELRSLRDNH
jgi:hypothetical protein